MTEAQTARAARPPSRHTPPGPFTQLPLFEEPTLPAATPSSPPPAPETLVPIVAEPPKESLPAAVDVPSQLAQEVGQESTFCADIDFSGERVLLAWPFACPPEPGARAIERCVDRLSASSIGGKRDAGFWQLVVLLCAKQAEERHAGWPRRFVAEPKEAKSAAGAEAIAARIRCLCEQMQTTYPGLFADEDRLQLQAGTLAPVVLALCDQNLLRGELDPFGAAYQQWAGARAREWRAQFFTPMGVAYFVVSLLQPQSHERVLDASCGVGVFFRALALYRRTMLVGMAPLLAETGHAVTEEEHCAQLTRYMRTRVYGADLDGTAVRLARVQLGLLDGDPSHVYHLDSLAFPAEAGEEAASAPIPFGSVDLVVGNPPYGLPVTDPAILRSYALARIWQRQGETSFLCTDRLQKKVPTEILFLEQAMNWLKPGGRMALVVPESLLGNPGTAYARCWLMQQAYVIASISLPVETFQAQSRTGVHTGVLVVRKKTEAEREEEDAHGSHEYSVYMAMAEHVGYDSRGRTVYARTPAGDLLMSAGSRQVDNDLPILLADFWRYLANDKIDPPAPVFFVANPRIAA